MSDQGALERWLELNYRSQLTPDERLEFIALTKLLPEANRIGAVLADILSDLARKYKS